MGLLARKVGGERTGCAIPVAFGAIGFIAGLATARLFLPDLDIDRATPSPMQRVLCFATLCAVGAVVAGLLIRMVAHLFQPSRATGVAARMISPAGALTAAFAAWACYQLYDAAFGTDRWRTPRRDCVNNLRYLGLALYNYQDAYGCFPPPFVPDGQGKPMHSWRVLVLPFLGEQALYSSYNFSEPWDGPNNRRLAGRMPEVYRCPSDPGRRPHVSSYLAVTGEGTAFPGGRPVRSDQIRDGTDRTILLIEVGASGVPWMQPADMPAHRVEFANREVIGGNHPGGMNVLLGDGSLKFIKETVKPQTLKALLTIDGGENVDRDDY